MQYRDLSGKKFGRLTVIKYDHSDKNRNACFECVCDCGNHCRFVDQKTQVRNRTNTVFITHNGETKALIEWCEKYGIKYKLAHERYLKGFPFEKIFYKGNLRKHIGTEC